MVFKINKNYLFVKHFLEKKSYFFELSGIAHNFSWLTSKSQ